MQPRLAGTFAMAFFSISVLLNLAGVRLGDLKAADFKPGNIRATITRDYYTGRAQVIRYYENMRLVYELQSRLRDLRNALPQQQEQAPEEKKNKKEKENRNMSNQPSQDQQNYVQADTGNYEIASYTIPIKDYRAQFSPSGSRHLQSVGARQRRMA
jgi:hypothetical protein